MIYVHTSVCNTNSHTQYIHVPTQTTVTYTIYMYVHTSVYIQLHIQYVGVCYEWTYMSQCPVFEPLPASWHLTDMKDKQLGHHNTINSNNSHISKHGNRNNYTLKPKISVTCTHSLYHVHFQCVLHCLHLISRTLFNRATATTLIQHTYLPIQ